MKAPNERTRLYFLLAWFHAVVQERLRYCPLGPLDFFYFHVIMLYNFFLYGLRLGQVL